MTGRRHTQTARRAGRERKETPMRYVIIGNSAAAVGCIEGIRSADKTGELILIR